MVTIISKAQREKALRIYARALPLIADAVGIPPKLIHNRVLRMVLFQDMPTFTNTEPDSLPVRPVGGADASNGPADAISSEPEPQPEQESPKVLTSALKPMAMQPVVGSMVHLRNKASGAYLHFSGLLMTMEKTQRWVGTQKQALACRDKFDLAKDLQMVAAQSAPRRDQ